MLALCKRRETVKMTRELRVSYIIKLADWQLVSTTTLFHSTQFHLDVNARPSAAIRGAMATEDRVFCYRSFNLHALLSRATELRKVQCSCDRSTEPASGSLNWAVFIRFEDGVEWVFVSPRLDTRISPETTAKMIQSKVATMKFIKLNSSIPVPEVYDCR